MAKIFELKEGVGFRGGLTVEIGEGPAAFGAATPCLYIHDDAFGFIDPILANHAINYGPGARYGVTEVSAEAWRSVIQDLRVLAGRLSGGVAPSEADINWVHTVDLDDDVETDSATFRRRFDDPVQREALAGFLVGVADWIDGRLERHSALTVYGV